MQSGRLEQEQQHFVSHFWLSLVLLSFSTELSPPAALNYHFVNFWFGGRAAIALKESRIYAKSSERTTENCCLPQSNLLPGLFPLAIFLMGCVISEEAKLTYIYRLHHLCWIPGIPKALALLSVKQQGFLNGLHFSCHYSPLAFSACLFPLAHLVNATNLIYLPQVLLRFCPAISHLCQEKTEAGLQYC